jgi:hypothetical protein
MAPTGCATMRIMIIVRLKGALGNQLFQYALGRALSLKYNVPLRFNIESYEDVTKRPFRSLYKGTFTQRTYDLDLFTVAGDVAKKSEIPFLHRMYGKGSLFLIFDALRRRMLKYIFKQKAQELFFSEYNPNYLNLGPNVYLDGFYQSPKYFDHIADIIKKDITLKNPLPKHIQTLSEEISSTNSVCVFYRRTDFIGNKDYEFVTDEYYTKALEYIQTHTNLEKIYVFSDDIEWCKENVYFGIPTMFVDNTYAGERYVGKFMLMCACKHFIIPNSSYGWWAAWLSNNPNKIVVAPKYWFKGTNIHDVIPDTWKIL